MASEMFYLVKDLGFPIVVACLLIVDKIKSQKELIEVVKNNTQVLSQVKDRIQ